MEIAPWEAFIRSTALHAFVRDHEPWLWPLMQALHYVGASLLIGTVGLFDLRALGLARGIALSAFHRLIPFGIAGYALNLALGIVFFFGHPDQYFYNNAFRLKMSLMAVAGINVALFYASSAFAKAKAVAPGADAPRRVKVIAGISLAMWVAILICGRLITFFRPPFFH
ncbi:MAG TPA: hypothetical protein VKW08_13625 [Xanthobacteraceae bacterium]|jgi:hypothetical protein|nr:hypothetical protein [Xanthobacteraceae bacterium]